MIDTQRKIESYVCNGCGASMVYAPGTTELQCEYCDNTETIENSNQEIHELDYSNYLQKVESETKEDITIVSCHHCGAENTISDQVQSTNCGYCATPLVLEEQKHVSIIQPKSLLPFYLSKEQAQEAFEKWVAKLWFAPSDLKNKKINKKQLQAVFTPFWTYDMETVTDYRGERGEYYYVNESYTSFENGKHVRKTRRVRKTRWYRAYGTVRKFFNDILIPATKSLPKKKLDKLGPWDLGNLIPFNKKYLAGTVTEKYKVELREGYQQACTFAYHEITYLIKRDIGGDTQRISSRDTICDEITFKHILLPVFTSTYTIKDKKYQFLINARTGEVIGDRPWHYGKIFLAVGAVLAVVGIVVGIVSMAN